MSELVKTPTDINIYVHLKVFYNFSDRVVKTTGQTMESLMLSPTSPNWDLSTVSTLPKMES